MHEPAETSRFQGKLVIYAKDFRFYYLILFQDAVVLKNKLLYAIESGAGFELS